MPDAEGTRSLEVVPADKSLHVEIAGELRRQVLHAAVELDCEPEEFCLKAIAAAVQYVSTRNERRHPDTPVPRQAHDQGEAISDALARVMAAALAKMRPTAAEPEPKGPANYTRGRF